MRWVAITKKTAREMIRDRSALFFTLLFPVIFILLFGVAFGTFTGGGNTTYNIAIINYDEGIVLNDVNMTYGDNFIEILKDLKYQDNEGKNTSTYVFDVRTDLLEEKAQELLQKLGIVVPPPCRDHLPVYNHAAAGKGRSALLGIQSTFGNRGNLLPLDDSGGRKNLDPVAQAANGLARRGDLPGDV